MLKYLARRLLYSFRKDAVTIDALDNKQRNEESDMGNIKAVFVGTGMIGAGLAANAMLNGYQTVLYDVVPHEKMRQNISHILDILVGAGAATIERAEALSSLCAPSTAI